MRGLRWSLVIGTLGALTSCAGGTPLLGGGALPEAFEAEYQIHADDRLEISVWGQEALSRTVVVRGDGTFSFPLLGEITAQGRTTGELEQLLAQGLAEGYLKTPIVTIKLAGQRFSVLGEVERPGTYELDGRVDLLAAVSMAGGLSKFGSPRLEVMRVLADGQKASYEVDLNGILSGRRPTVILHPHDTIHVKRRLI